MPRRRRLRRTKIYSVIYHQLRQDTATLVQAFFVLFSTNLRCELCPHGVKTLLVSSYTKQNQGSCRSFAQKWSRMHCHVSYPSTSNSWPSPPVLKIIAQSLYPWMSSAHVK